MIPDKAVEAAVKAWDHHWGDRYGDEALEEMGEEVRIALEAAAPFIAAKALEDAAADAPRRHDEVISAEECRDWAEWLRVYAAAVRGEG
jgi:hypothetical protein